MSHWDTIDEFIEYYKYQIRDRREGMMVLSAEIKLLETLAVELRLLKDSLEKAMNKKDKNR